MPSRISESKEKEIISLYVEEFMDGVSVAKRVGVHAGTAYNQVKDMGIPCLSREWDKIRDLA